MDFRNLAKNILEDVKVDLTQEFDRNFERKSFFDRRWPQTNHPHKKGSLMVKSGDLRRSINKPKIKGNSIQWTSSLPYAIVNNEGGEIKVTKKMKSFFWAMYYKAFGAISFSIKKKAMVNTIRNKKLSDESAKWRAMALMKEGTILKVEERRFIGWHPQVDVSISKVIDINMREVNKELIRKFKP